MREIKLTALILLLTTSVINAKSEYKLNVKPKVDKRVELLSVVCRLAGFEEYVNDNIPNYAKDVDAYFADYRLHKLISLAKKLNTEQGISYDAIASIATSIKIDKEIKLKNDLLLKGIDKRWNKESIDVFIDHLNSFYKETNFTKFFSSHKDLYLVAEKNFSREILKDIDFSWFENFYGAVPNADFYIILGMLNGHSNYGVTNILKDGKEDINVIIGVKEADGNGTPIFPAKEITVQTVVHEFSHSFCNRLIDIYYKDLKTKAEDFFDASEEYISYPGARSMSYEILVRACVIQYFKAHVEKISTQKLINKERAKGFIWIQELFNALNEYGMKREKYPTLYDFMPQIVSIQNNLNVDEIKINFEKALANIESISIANDDSEIDYKINHIVIEFDRKTKIAEGIENPVFYSIGESEDFKPYMHPVNGRGNEQKSWTVPIDLNPDTKYTFAIPQNAFLSEDDLPLSEMYIINFKTRKKLIPDNFQKLPKNKRDWMSFDSYSFSGNSSGYTFKGDIHFERNGVEMDIKKDTVIFMKNACMKTNSFLIKLEQDKLIISSAEELTNLKYDADKVVEKENKICLTGNASLKLSDKSSFKANEIIIEKTAIKFRTRQLKN
ncbi:DUF4932 domain-containing protein [Puteibacter caeruleilacunae]|nr:DUF4932 domain-containing protein [Puteibacter caeruleilacunae]